ncbi:MAG: hypothetical protein ACXVL8_18910 [Acidimicrobiia bacterium]
MSKSERITRVVGPRRFRAGLVMLAVGLAVVGVSCSDGDSATPATSDAARSRSTTTTTTTTAASTTTQATSSASAPTRRTVEDEIIARYMGFWTARFAANRGVPNPDDPALREFATGEQLAKVVDETRANLEQGLSFRRAANPSNIQRVTVIELDGDHAVVQECVVADGVIVRRDTGAVVNDDVATHNVRGELARVDGVWRVSSARLVQRWEGVAGCALAS